MAFDASAAFSNSVVLDEIELERSTEYESYLKKIIEFLKANEDIYYFRKIPILKCLSREKGILRIPFSKIS